MDKKKYLDTISSTAIENLLDEEFMVNLIRGWGIHNDPAIDFGQVNEPYRNEFGMLQQPEQLAPCLIYLSTKKIRNYCEIGVFSGSTFIFIMSYLKRFNPYIKGMAIDIGLHLDPHNLANCNFPVETIIGTSDIAKERIFDLVMIDADHKYESVVKDYNNVGQYAKICMMHDINDEGVVLGRDNAGSKKFWLELKNKLKDKKFTEFTNHPENKNIMGIGLIE